MKKRHAEDEILLGHLEQLAENLGVKVRYEQIKKESAFFPGGLCRVRNKDIIIINSKAAVEDRITILSEALSSFDLSDVYILPALRDLLSGETPA